MIGRCRIFLMNLILTRMDFSATRTFCAPWFPNENHIKINHNFSFIFCLIKNGFMLIPALSIYLFDSGLSLSLSLSLSIFYFSLLILNEMRPFRLFSLIFWDSPPRVNIRYLLLSNFFFILVENSTIFFSIF